MNKEKPPNIIVLFHSLLIAYQIALRDLLGSGRAIFFCPVLENFTKINEMVGLETHKGQGPDAALQTFTKTIEDAGFVRNFSFEKLGELEYVLHIDGCIWAPKIHKKFNMKDLACPFALMAMSIVQACSGKKIKCTDSEYLEEGTRTKIEVLKSTDVQDNFKKRLTLGEEV